MTSSIGLWTKRVEASSFALSTEVTTLGRSGGEGVDTHMYTAIPIQSD